MRCPSRLAASLIAAVSAVSLSACGTTSSTVASLTTTTLNLPAAGGTAPSPQPPEHGSQEVLDGDTLWDNTTEIPQAAVSYTHLTLPTKA